MYDQIVISQNDIFACFFFVNAVYSIPSTDGQYTYNDLSIHSVD